MRMYFLRSLLLAIFFLLVNRVNSQPDYSTNGRVFTSMSQALMQPDSVFRLKLRRKGYKQIPPEVFNFKNLRELDLIGNKIERIPNEIGSLLQLEILRLGGNQIEVIGKEIAGLNKLRYLDLGKNKIQALPFEIGELNDLEFLQIWGNDITLLPESIQNLNKLKYLDMRAILLTDSEREDVLEQLPQTEIFISPGCNCGK
jgi:leucine-rich repeat protein SHOC2